jgi:hypothetical protein
VVVGRSVVVGIVVVVGLVGTVVVGLFFLAAYAAACSSNGAIRAPANIRVRRDTQTISTKHLQANHGLYPFTPSPLGFIFWCFLISIIAIIFLRFTNPLSGACCSGVYVNLCKMRWLLLRLKMQNTYTYCVLSYLIIRSTAQMGKP